MHWTKKESWAKIRSEMLALPKEDDFVGLYMALLNEVPTLQPFHKAFVLYRFVVIFVGIADRAVEVTLQISEQKLLVLWRSALQ